jgi:multiple sugar transport system permease protein
MSVAQVSAPDLQRRRRGAWRQREGWLLLVPALIPVLVFSIAPLLQGIYLGFTNAEAGYNIQVDFNWFDNYARLLKNTLFWQSFQIGFSWAIATTVLQYGLGLGLALLLNERLRLRGLARLLALVPWAMPSVIVAIMWRLVYLPDNGLLNGALQTLHLQREPVNWLGDFSRALPAVILVGAWAGMAPTTVALLGGLQVIPGEIYEAAHVDGARVWQRFAHITWPQLRPVTEAIISLDFIWNFNSFGLVYVLTGGGPGGQTMLPALFAYNEAFKYGHFGYAAAMGNVMVIIVVGLLAVYLRLQRRGQQ